VTKCPWCSHSREDDGCPYLDHVGNLRRPGVECPDVCGRPTTTALVLPFATVRLCDEHFTEATGMLS
jgi:hypothetical protein